MLSAVCHTENSLLIHEELHQVMLRELAQAMEMTSLFSPFEAKFYIGSIFKNSLGTMPTDLFEKLSEDDSLEMWSTDYYGNASDLKFLFAMGAILKMTSFSMEDLSSTPWTKLFLRDEFNAKLILHRVVQAMVTGETQSNVTGWHLVSENGSPKQLQFQVRVAHIIPFKSTHGSSGVFGLVKSRPLPEVTDDTETDSLASLSNFPQSLENLS
jgi:hypothetical protein